MPISLFKHAKWLLLLFVLITPQLNASVIIYGTRIIYDGSLKSKNITIKNQGKLPALLQSWVSHSQNPQQIAPFVINPALSRLEAGKEQVLRIIYTGEDKNAAKNSQVEQFYLFNMLEVPPKPDLPKDSNYLQISLTHQLKLFYRPAGIKADMQKSAAQITWHLDKNRQTLTAHNPSSIHITITQVRMQNIDFAAQKQKNTITEGMIAPQQSLPFVAAKAPPQNAEQVFFAYMDDYGNEREASAILRLSK